MSLLVYIPDLRTPKTFDSLRAVGLGGLHDEGLSLNGAEVLNGPDGTSGVVFSWPVGPQIAAGYFPDSQTWHKCSKDGDKEAGRAWVGWNSLTPPKPEELARKRVRMGEPVILNDGNYWTVPIAKALPRVVGGFDENGKVKMTVAKAYEEFFNASFQTLERYVSANEGGAPMTWEEAFEYAVKALAVNYRVNRDIVAAMGILTTDLLWTVCETTTEFKQIAEALSKKKEPPAI